MKWKKAKKNLLLFLYKEHQYAKPIDCTHILKGSKLDELTAGRLLSELHGRKIIVVKTQSADHVYDGFALGTQRNGLKITYDYAKAEAWLTDIGIDYVEQHYKNKPVLWAKIAATVSFVGIMTTIIIAYLSPKVGVDDFKKENNRSDTTKQQPKVPL